MELFDSTDMTSRKQSDAAVALVSMLKAWNVQLGLFVGKMMDNISTDPNYYTDETYADMMSLCYTGEEYDRVMHKINSQFRNFDVDTYIQAGGMPKQDFYQILFTVTEAKTYIVEMDSYASKIGVRIPLGLNIPAMVEDALKLLNNSAL